MERRRVRVRVVHDPRGYRRYRRKRLFRFLGWAAFWGGLLTVILAVMWLILQAVSGGVRP
jgi:hypothetical protein